MTNGQQFEAFMKDYQNMVFSTAMRLVANEAEAEDISQEVFMRAYDRFDELGDSPTAGGWLKTVTRNLSLNHLTRYRARWSFFSELFSRGDEAESDAQIEFPADDALTGDKQLANADRRAVVERALSSLPQAQRVPLVLYHFDGLRYEEIAEQLGVSLGKVKTDIFRGREALRQKLSLALQDEMI
ncbi:MAG TPA: sigma-70 family RNA polymerase sigma factor [Verrucomicrobiota bacterium]|nr:sigma-70 family RNA polymerase sigma factor [Verrucomicrobiota bacterium]